MPQRKIIQCLIFVDYLTALAAELEMGYVLFISEQLGQKSTDMWFTLDQVKEFDSHIEKRDGISLQKQLRDAEEPIRKAKEEAKREKETRQQAIAEAEMAPLQAAAEAEMAKQTATREIALAKSQMIWNLYHDLKLDTSAIAKIVEMPEMEVRSVLAKRKK